MGLPPFLGGAGEENQSVVWALCGGSTGSGTAKTLLRTSVVNIQFKFCCTLMPAISTNTGIPSWPQTYYESFYVHSLGLAILGEVLGLVGGTCGKCRDRVQRHKGQTHSKSSACPEEVFPVLDLQRQSALKKRKASSEARKRQASGQSGKQDVHGNVV